MKIVKLNIVCENDLCNIYKLSACKLIHMNKLNIKVAFLHYEVAFLDFPEDFV